MRSVSLDRCRSPLQFVRIEVLAEADRCGLQIAATAAHRRCSRFQEALYVRIRIGAGMAAHALDGRVRAMQRDKSPGGGPTAAV